MVHDSIVAGFLPYGESSGDTKLLPGEPFRRFTLNSPFHVFRVFESSYDVSLECILNSGT